MEKNNEIKPRQLAQIMVREFIDGGQIHVDPDKYPKHVKAIAITHARNTAARVIFHARKSRTDKRYRSEVFRLTKQTQGSSGRSMAIMVLAYEKARGR